MALGLLSVHRNRTKNQVLHCRCHGDSNEDAQAKYFAIEAEINAFISKTLSTNQQKDEFPLWFFVFQIKHFLFLRHTSFYQKKVEGLFMEQFAQNIKDLGSTVDRAAKQLLIKEQQLSS